VEWVVAKAPRWLVEVGAVREWVLGVEVELGGAWLGSGSAVSRGGRKQGKIGGGSGGLCSGRGEAMPGCWVDSTR